MYKNLREYIVRLEREGELRRIGVEVDPVLEIAEITDRESKRPGGGKALLFERTGTPFPVLTNMMGSARRIAMALGVDDLDELPARIEGLFDAVTRPMPGLADKMKMLPLLRDASRWLPRHRRGRGACQATVRTGADADLALLPVLKCWPCDGGRFVTLPLVHTRDPETGGRNVGMYRMQLFSGQAAGMHWHLHKTGERHYRGYRAQGRRMPVAVCLGGDPVYTYSAVAPLPDHIDEYLLAGFLRRRPVELVRCITNELMVPADCDFVIEGYVDPAEEKVLEGPFGDHTGFYSLEDYYPVFHVTAVTHRADAVYPATIVGIPPQEDAWIAAATEKIFLAPIRKAMLPEVRDLYMPPAGVAHNIAVVDIRKEYPGQGLKTASSLWGAGQMMFNKFAVVTASGGDIRDPAALAALMRRIDPQRDVMFARGPLDVLDHAAPECGSGGKMVFDLTGIDPSAPAEAVVFPAAGPAGFRYGHGITGADTSYAEQWGALVLTAGPGVPLSRIDVPAFLRDNGIAGIRFALVMDDAVDTSRGGDLLWLAAGNCDPSRDVLPGGGVIVFDGRSKTGGLNGFARRWPNPVASDRATVALVDRRWNDYGLGGFVPSPSLRYIPLQSGEGAAAGEQDASR